jgi:hypothetical protein
MKWPRWPDYGSLELRFRKASFSVTWITSVLPVTRGESPVGLYDGGSVVLGTASGNGLNKWCGSRAGGYEAVA